VRIAWPTRTHRCSITSCSRQREGVTPGLRRPFGPPPREPAPPGGLSTQPLRGCPCYGPPSLPTEPVQEGHEILAGDAVPGMWVCLGRVPNGAQETPDLSVLRRLPCVPSGLDRLRASDRGLRPRLTACLGTRKLCQTGSGEQQSRRPQASKLPIREPFRRSCFYCSPDLLLACSSSLFLNGLLRSFRPSGAKETPAFFPAENMAKVLGTHLEHGDILGRHPLPDGSGPSLHSPPPARPGRGRSGAGRRGVRGRLAFRRSGFC
jgi:hypothetical protein